MDPDAWEALYRRGYGPLFAYARRRLKTIEEADDAVSETMARAFDRVGGFSWQGAGFDGWLFGILRNVVLERFRYRNRAGPELSDEIPTADPEPLEAMIADEEVREVRSAFERLGPGDRELLELRVMGGLSAEDVGHVLGKGPGAVRMAQSRALARLRSLMEEGVRER
jgi:RNA polymerase sigma-70 factor (ECF subfamily)